MAKHCKIKMMVIDKSYKSLDWKPCNQKLDSDERCKDHGLRKENSNKPGAI